MVQKITLKLDFSKRQDEKGYISRKAYTLFYLSTARRLVISGSVNKCLIEGYFYPEDLKIIRPFVEENPDVTISYASPINAGSYCTIVVVKSDN